MSDAYLQALIGGILLGSGAILLMLTVGKIAGISGITYTAISSLKTDNYWRWAFLLGLIIAPILTTKWGYDLPNQLDISMLTAVLAGLLVGIGTKLGAGCTSGHGICGIGRLSTRSIVATCVFMAVAALTVAVVRHLL